MYSGYIGGSFLYLYSLLQSDTEGFGDKNNITD